MWEEEALCSVCMELFEDPVILDCSHNVCSKCATQLYEFECKVAATELCDPRKPNQTSLSPPSPSDPASCSTANQAKSQSISCPECRASTAVTPGLQSLKRNLTLRNLVTRLQEERQKKASVLCGNCEHAQATFECHECGFELCAECKDSQHQKGRFKLHTVVPLGQLHKIRPEACPTHKKDLDLFCTQDQCAVCIYCLQLGPHQQHPVMPLSDAVDKAKSDINSLMDKVKERNGQLSASRQQLESQIPSVEEMTQKLCQQVKSYFNGLRQVLDSREDELVTEIQNKEQGILKSFKQQQETIASITTQVMTTLENCGRVVETSSATDLLKAKQKMANRLNNILHMETCTPESIMSMLETWTFQPTEGVMDNLQTLGKVVVSPLHRAQAKDSAQVGAHSSPSTFPTASTHEPFGLLSLQIRDKSPPKAPLVDESMIKITLLPDLSQPTPMDTPIITPDFTDAQVKSKVNPRKRKASAPLEGPTVDPTAGGRRWQLKI